MSQAAASFDPASRWLRLAPGVAVVALALWLFRDTAQAMVAIWNRSGTYAHAFLVPPIAAWLAWRSRDRLQGLDLRPAWWMLLPMALACALWLVAELGLAQAPTQLALVTLLILSVPAVFGWPLARAFRFPLLFLYFAVPVGDFLVPTMMEWTADFTVAAVRLSGVPVYREGFQFVLPTGNWSVVDACSGVRYLIASFMVGTLFAYLNYSSLRRRLMFVLVSLLVPLVANWLRAYMIVMLGHLSNNQIAVGVDHVLYGWVFFGIVVSLMFLIGMRWSEPEVPPVAAGDAGHAPFRGGVANWAAVGLVLALLAATRLAGAHLAREHEVPLPPLELPAAWSGVAAGEPFTPWEPVYRQPRAHAMQSYGTGAGRFGVWVGYYRDQGYENKMLASTNVLAESHTESRWAQELHGTRTVPAGSAGNLSVRVAEVRAAMVVGGSAAGSLRAWQIYWAGGRFTASEAEARTRIVIDRLLGRHDDAAVVVFFTPIDASGEADERLARVVPGGLADLGERLQRLRAVD